ncbi:hypothetical protein LAD77_00775 [Klebsiella pneumoniae]|nr:hypothetical protein [Klebsiella pneumoniae]
MKKYHHVPYLRVVCPEALNDEGSGLGRTVIEGPRRDGWRRPFMELADTLIADPSGLNEVLAGDVPGALSRRPIMMSHRRYWIGLD